MQNPTLELTSFLDVRASRKVDSRSDQQIEIFPTGIDLRDKRKLLSTPIATTPERSISRRVVR